MAAIQEQKKTKQKSDWFKERKKNGESRPVQRKEENVRTPTGLKK